ncbi:hypothetical protein [uncultured Gammaproteobacteria bacterium]|nr:hypothetical protein [uncultured Gammaproteobacteria bacterium]
MHTHIFPTTHQPIALLFPNFPLSLKKAPLSRQSSENNS